MIIPPTTPTAAVQGVKHSHIATILPDTLRLHALACMRRAVRAPIASHRYPHNHIFHKDRIMKSRLPLLAQALAAVAAIVLAFCTTTATASAQDLDTCCLRIANSTTCHITICISLPDGTEQCELISQQSRARFRFPCDSNTHFTATGACGVPTRLRPNECVRMLLRGTLCCADVCLSRGEDGCYEITITDSA